jgi:exosome complex RNA-binding protein Rrp42 (RNase PH superfamily)
MGVRLDGRALTDTKDFIVSYGTVPEAFGSCTVVSGQQDNV